MSESIAVIIPSYNHAEYIGIALDSVLTQTRPAERILVLDDGSTDNSTEILEAYQEQGVEIYTQNNAGAHNCLNSLVQKAATDCSLIAILNSDDSWEPTRLEKAEKHFQKNPQDELLVTAFQLIDETGKALPSDHARAKWFEAVWSLQEKENLELHNWLGIANFAATSSNFVAKSSFLLSHPFANYRYIHDYYSLLHAAIRGTLALNPGKLLNYRVHSSNTISTQPKELIVEMLQMFLDLQKHYHQQGFENPQQELRLNSLLHNSADNLSCFHDGLYQKIVRQLLSDCSPQQLRSIIDNLPEEAYLEFPNKDYINSHQTELGTMLSSSSGLAATQQLLRRENQELKEKANPASNNLHLARSRWLSLCRLLGLGGKLFSQQANSDQNRKSILQNSSLVQLGAKLGSRSCQKLLSG